MPNRSQYASQKEFLEYYRKYRELNREKLRKYNREYNKKYRRIHGYANEAQSKRRYPEKQLCRNKLTVAIRAGRIKREPCIVCKSEKSQAHHDDYTKPYEVKWLCALHHTEYHRNNTENINKK
jgi:hypothetical protein